MYHTREAENLVADQSKSFDVSVDRSCLLNAWGFLKSKFSVHMESLKMLVLIPVKECYSNKTHKFAG